jgi:multiple sugar transport system permease protein
MRTSRTSTIVLIAPWLIVAGAFWFFPLVWSFYLSVTDSRLLGGGSVFVGVSNFARLLLDPATLNALKVTFIFTAGTVPVTTALALVFALALNRLRRFRGMFRAGVFLPVVTPLVVSALVFAKLYAREGYLGALASLVGFTTGEVGLLHSPATALPSVMFMDVWLSVGYYAILLLAALQTAPRELGEAADVDGARGLRRFYVSVWPYVRPMLVFAVVINSIKSLQIFVEVYVMTQGGPLGTTTTAVYHLYDTAFRSGEAGYGSAFAVLLFIITVGLSVAQVRVLSRAGGTV